MEIGTQTTAYEQARSDRWAHMLRILRVMAGIEFKLKYADSKLGYIWTVVKPLVLFSVMYAVFSRLAKLSGFPHFGVYLLLGIVLWVFFIDATMTAMPSIVVRGSLLRKLSFPRLAVPLSVSLTAVFSLFVNLVVVALFAAAAKLAPRPEWLLLLPLILELYVFAAATGVILSALFVRFRDIGQIWELVMGVLVYAVAVMYPIQYLPKWGQGIVLIIPFAQIMQDARIVLIHPPSTFPTFTPYYFGSVGRLLPILITVGLAAFAYWFFRRESPYFAERA